MTDDFEKTVLTKEAVAAKVKELAKKISKDYADKNALFVCVLKGATVFFADLIREITAPVLTDYIAVSSYRENSTGGEIILSKDLAIDAEGKDVVVVEDIIDSGKSMKYLTEYLRTKKPKSLAVCVLLDRKTRRDGGVIPDYTAFRIGDGFLVGYGLDYAEKYRNLPDIRILKKSVYEK